MIRNQPFPHPLSWRNRRPRQRVIHSAAQVTWCFLLGLSVVSLLIWLNLFLASRTAALEVKIQEIRKQCQEQEWKNTQLMRRVALETNIEQVENYARSHGFTLPPRVEYLALTEEGERPQDLIAVNGPSQGTVEGAGISASSPWRVILHRLQEVVTLPRRVGPVAHRR